MLEKKEIDIDGKKFTISKFPALAGREIIHKYFTSENDMLDAYEVNEEMLCKMMSYVFIDIKGKSIPLSTKELINNHVHDWEVLKKIEIALMEYNCSFFPQGRT